MIENLLGIEQLPIPVKLIVAFAVVLALLGIVAWLFRRLGGSRLGTTTARGRQPRLAVIDAAAVDGRRRLVLIRRDNVEHLIMIGGPTDVVVEQNILRAVPVAPPREAPPPRMPGEAIPRAAPEAYRPEPPPRPPQPEMRPEMHPDAVARPPRAEPPARRPADLERARGEEYAPSSRMPPPEAARPARTQPPPSRFESESINVHPAPPTADANLADMAQKLEAALRRPASPNRPEPPESAITPPLAEPTPPTAPEVDANGSRGPANPPSASHAGTAPETKQSKPEIEVSCAEVGVRQPRGRDGEPAWPSPREEVMAPRRTLLSALLPMAAAIAAVMAANPAAAQDVSVSFGQGTGLTERAVQIIALITVLSLAPSILVMVTSFTRIVVVLSLLRTALGTATAPPNAVIVSLALFLTVFVMGPAFQRAYEEGIRPLTAGEISPEQAFERSSEPFRAFMLKNVREKDLALFMDLSRQAPPDKPDDISMRILTPAFMISELKRAFEIGFLLFLPFLIIDLVVASVLMSMGMMMLPPVVVSLPFKLIFFVLVDGWNLVAGSLVQSYGSG